MVSYAPVWEKLAYADRISRWTILFWRHGMTTLVLEHDPIAITVEVTDEHIQIHLADGRIISAPLEWYPRLAHATLSERNHYELLGRGSAIGWPELDEHLSVESILAGRSSGESQHSFQRWLATRQNISNSP